MRTARSVSSRGGPQCQPDEAARRSRRLSPSHHPLQRVRLRTKVMFHVAMLVFLTLII